MALRHHGSFFGFQAVLSSAGSGRDRDYDRDRRSSRSRVFAPQTGHRT